jgi:hypothetical protein
MEAANISTADLDVPAGSGGLSRRNSTGIGGRRSSIGMARTGSSGVCVAAEVAVVADAAAAAAAAAAAGDQVCVLGWVARQQGFFCSARAVIARHQRLT